MKTLLPRQRSSTTNHECQPWRWNSRTKVHTVETRRRPWSPWPGSRTKRPRSGESVGRWRVPRWRRVRRKRIHWKRIHRKRIHRKRMNRKGVSRPWNRRPRARRPIRPLRTSPCPSSTTRWTTDGFRRGTLPWPRCPRTAAIQRPTTRRPGGFWKWPLRRAGCRSRSTNKGPATAASILLFWTFFFCDLPFIVLWLYVALYNRIPTVNLSRFRCFFFFYSEYQRAVSVVLRTLSTLLYNYTFGYYRRWDASFYRGTRRTRNV